MRKEEVVIIGAGLAGLTAAYYLKKAGLDPLILEAADHIGGRVVSDEENGYILDRGFQILLTSYPEAKSVLNYDDLELQYFGRGAEIYKEGELLSFYDPAEGIGGLVKTLTSGPGAIQDWTKLLGLRSLLAKKSIEDIYKSPPQSTIEYLRKKGFSDKLIETFWKPFYQGIFLENDLRTSSRLFEFTFKMFIDEGAAVPLRGMGEIPKQLASHLHSHRIRLQTKVVDMGDNMLTLADGEKISCERVIIACDSKQLRPEASGGSWKTVTNVYFQAPSLPRSSSYVMLNANEIRVVNNVAFMSEVSSAYAPKGQHLISVSANGAYGDKIEVIVDDLRKLYGEDVRGWKHLKTYTIHNALPDTTVCADYNPRKGDGIYVAGDHQLEGSINAAMKSGRLAAEALLRDLN